MIILKTLFPRNFILRYAGTTSNFRQTETYIQEGTVISQSILF